MLVIKDKTTRNIADNQLEYYKKKGYKEAEKPKEEKPSTKKDKE